MRERVHAPRLLAADLRSRRSGFAVLEGPHQLLEWGATGYSGIDDPAMVVRKRIAPLLTLFSPSVIVVRQAVKPATRYRIIMKAVEQEAGRHSAEVVVVGRDEISRLFGKHGRVTKYEIACQIALLFPELTWKLPPQRKIWMSEHHNGTIFDAVSAGLAYFARFGDVFAGNPRLPG